MQARLCGLSLLIASAVATLLFPTPLRGADKTTFQINSYVVDADLDPTSHHLTATVQVNFTALEAAETLVFQLHNSLKVNKVTDGSKTPLSGERGQDATIRITPRVPLSKGQTGSYTFQYDGTLTGTEDGPVEGLKLTSIGDPISYLLYAGRWFPMTGFLTNRFTAEMHIRVPAGYRVVGSGSTGAPHSTRQGRAVGLQLEQAGISRNHHCRKIRGARLRSRQRQHQGLHHRRSSPGRDGLRPGGEQSIRVLHHHLRYRAVEPPECR